MITLTLHSSATEAGKRFRVKNKNAVLNLLPQIFYQLCLGLSLLTTIAIAEDVPFRPEAGKFPPLEKALSYRGELIFVDHANRRGSIRVQGSGMFFRNDPHPIAMLPYGIVRYHGAPADLRDIPLGTVMHVHAFLPPDTKTSAVPVLPVDSKKADANHNRGAGIFPAENHILLLEDEPSHCLRERLVWNLHEVEVKNGEGTIAALLGQDKVEVTFLEDGLTRTVMGKWLEGG